MKYRIIIITVLLLFSSLVNGQEPPTLYFNNLFSLHNAESPKYVTMAILGNTAKNRRSISIGILFTYKNRKAKQVTIAGNFSYWEPQPMHRSKHGVWYYYLQNNNDYNKITYKFMVDGIWTLDPLNNDTEDDKIGSYLSVIDVPGKLPGKHITYRIIDKNTIEFRTFKPRAKMISVVGDFNDWNPEQDLMTKNEHGIWYLRKRIPSGTYRYKFIVDGRWEPDFYNPDSSSDINGEVCSLFTIN